MAKIKYAKLKKGTTLVDYATPTKIVSAFEGDFSAIREEYSRLRSIVRKRVERMEKAGETDNPTYQRYGNVKVQLPTVKELSDYQILQMLSNLAQQVGGGFKTATLSQIRETRNEWRDMLNEIAEDSGDEELKELLKSKKLTDARIKTMQRMLGMIQKVVGTQLSSDEVIETTLKVVLSHESGTSLLQMAAEVINELGIDTDMHGKDALESLRERYTAEGTTRVNWAKAHKKRGK